MIGLVVNKNVNTENGGLSMNSLFVFLLGGLCGFVSTILVIFLYASLVVGGDKDE